MTKFPFNDLHSFKDYLAFVKMCAPDLFPVREGVPATEQWSLSLAFKGLYEGLVIAEQEKGPRPVFSECKEIFDAAHKEYLAGNRKGGFELMAKAQKAIKAVHSR